jgi:hypothetical protein
VQPDTSATIPGLRTSEVPGRAPVVAADAVQFSSSNYGVVEASTTVTFTVDRIGNTSSPATVDYFTSDLTTNERRDYITAIGRLRFAPGEASKSFVVLISDDSYVEGLETFNVTLRNPSGVSLGTPAIATATITGNANDPATNVIDNARSYVGQHYQDFLNRQPDASGWDFWTNVITSCGTNQSCIEIKRINVSAAYFLSIEFQETGYLVERTYKTAYGSANGSSTLGGTHQLPVPIVRFKEFLPDTQQMGQGVVVGQAGWEQVLESNKQAFALEFVQRSRFTTAFSNTLTPAQFVDLLFANAGVTPSTTDRNTAIGQFGADTNTTDATARARALRNVAENATLNQQEFNRAFVLMQYFGYLRRNPDDPQDTDYTGYDFWLTKLNQFNGNFINAEMVKAFITSGEYRQRFGGSVGSPGPPPALTPEQRLAALEAVRARFESLKNGADPDAVNQELLNFIRNRPEFAEAGISDDSCVWATYTDGVELIVVNNLDPDPPNGPALAPRPAVAPSVSANLKPDNFPDSTDVRLVFAHGTAFKNPVPEVQTWLGEQNYFQSPGRFGATVGNLKNVAGEGVFFFNGHGGKSKFMGYCLGTSTGVTPDLDQNFDTDLKKDAQGRVRLTYMLGRYDPIDSVKEEKYKVVYAITSEFIRRYWGNLSPNSFVFINACSSASAEASDFATAIKEKKASVYAGWTKAVYGNVAFNTSRFVFDRLLGANKVYLEKEFTGFNQRPFDYQSVERDLKLHGPGLGTDPETGAELQFFPLKDDFQMLAPSIWFMDLDEFNKTLRISGDFGDDPGQNSRAVLVGGQPCPVSSWDKEEIECDLPDSGPGASGEVIVTVRGQKSNTAHLTEWEGDFTHTVTGQGTLKQTVTYHIRLRADIRKVRTEIHEAPTFFGGDRAVFATADSIASYACSGTFIYTLDGSPRPVCTENWSGSGLLPRLPFLQTGPGFQALGSINDHRLLLQLSVKAGGERIVNLGCTPPGGSSNLNQSLFSPNVENGTNDPFNVDLDANFNIKANTLTGTDSQGNVHTVKWNLINAKNPPKADSPR